MGQEFYSEDDEGSVRITFDFLVDHESHRIYVSSKSIRTVLMRLAAVHSDQLDEAAARVLVELADIIEHGETEIMARDPEARL